MVLHHRPHKPPHQPVDCQIEHLSAVSANLNQLCQQSLACPALAAVAVDWLICPIQPATFAAGGSTALVAKIVLCAAKDLAASAGFSGAAVSAGHFVHLAEISQCADPKFELTPLPSAKDET